MALISNASIWEKSSVVRVDVQIRTFGIEAHLLGYFLVFPFWWKIVTVWIKLFSELSVIKILWHGSLSIQDVQWRHLSVSDTSCCQWGETVIIDGELISWFYMGYLHPKGSFQGLKRAGIKPPYNSTLPLYWIKTDNTSLYLSELKMNRRYYTLWACLELQLQRILNPISRRWRQNGQFARKNISCLAFNQAMYHNGDVP